MNPNAMKDLGEGKTPKVRPPGAPPRANADSAPAADKNSGDQVVGKGGDRK
jgi:hypothetical protein